MTFRYKDKRVKYFYMIALASLTILSSDLWNIGSWKFSSAILTAIITSAISFIAIVMALFGLWNRTVFGKQKVSFFNESSTTMKYTDINSIKASASGELSYSILYQEREKHEEAVEYLNSDADIACFRETLSKLITHVMDVKPDIDIDESTRHLADISLPLTPEQSDLLEEKRSALHGKGGWIAYIIYMLISNLATKGLILLSFSYLLSNSLISQSMTLGTVVAIIVLFLELILTIITLIQLFQRKIKFNIWFIYSRFFTVVSVPMIAILSLSLLEKSSSNFSVFSIVLSAITQLIWAFAWKAYIARSIRVKNTFIND